MKIFPFRVFGQLILIFVTVIFVGCASNNQSLVKPTPKPNPLSIEDDYSIKLHVYPTPISVGDILSDSTKASNNELNVSVKPVSSNSSKNVENQLEPPKTVRIPTNGEHIKLPSIHISGKRQTKDLVTLETTPFTEIPFTEDSFSRPMLFTDLVRKDHQWKFTSSAVNALGDDFGSLVGAMDATWSPDGKKLAYVSEDQFALAIASDQGEIFLGINSFVHYPIFEWLSWSPNSQFLAVMVFNWCAVGSNIAELVIIDVDNKTLKRYDYYEFWQSEGTEDGPTKFSKPTQFRWSPDGKKLLISWDYVMVLDVFNNKYEYILKEGIIPDWSADSEGIYYLKYQEPNNRTSNDSVTGMYFLSIEDDSYPKLIASENDLKTLLGVSQNQKISGFIDQSNDGSQLALSISSGSNASEYMSKVFVFDILSERLMHLEQPQGVYEISKRIESIQWSVDGGSISAIISSDKISLELLNLSNGAWTLLKKLEIPPAFLPSLNKRIRWGS